MSTDEGHSALQVLQLTHNSITRNMRGLVSSPAGMRPEMAARSMLARPRVLCSSSRVAIKLGHIAPLPNLRQTAAPLHISISSAMPRGQCSLGCSSIVV